MRLNIASGTAVRFEPGDDKRVMLVRLGGARIVHGLNALTSGPANHDTRATALKLAAKRGFQGADK
jgi:urease beta subunit